MYANARIQGGTGGVSGLESSLQMFATRRKKRAVEQAPQGPVSAWSDFGYIPEVRLLIISSSHFIDERRSGVPPDRLSGNSRSLIKSGSFRATLVQEHVLETHD